MEIEDLDMLWAIIRNWTWRLFSSWRDWLVRWWFGGWGCDFDVVDCDGVGGPVVGWDTGLSLVLESSLAGMVQGRVGVRGEVEGYVEGLDLLVWFRKAHG